MKSKGQSTIQLVMTGAGAIAITYAFIYSSLYSPIAQAQYVDHATIASMNMKIDDMSKEVDFLASKFDYKVPNSFRWSGATTTNQ